MTKNTIQSLYNQAEIAHESEDYITAQKLYNKVLKLDQNDYDAHRWLADVYLELEQYPKAIKSFKNALALKGNDADVFNDAGLAYYEEEIPTQAVEMYMRGLEIAPNHSCLHSNLGKALYEMFLHDDKDKAKDIAKKWMETFPENADASFMGSALLGLNPADQNIDFVRATFDDFAHTFDEKLAELDYKAPELLCNALERHCLNLGYVLDAGCGTGLVAPLIKGMCDTITGVDLSQSMVDIAKKRNIYTKLYVQDLQILLTQKRDTYTAIIAADVLCYFGDLKRVMHNFNASLRESGILAFSLEKMEYIDTPNATEDNLGNTTGYVLNASGRYKHTEQSIVHILEKADFSIIELRTETLRTEHGNPVQGLVVIAQKSKGI